jgi:hypothetical protein
LVLILSLFFHSISSGLEWGDCRSGAQESAEFSPLAITSYGAFVLSRCALLCSSGPKAARVGAFGGCGNFAGGVVRCVAAGLKNASAVEP